jgi:hydroxypyruvate isomerase
VIQDPFLTDQYLSIAALSVIKSISSPYLKIQVDLFHLQQIHGDWTNWITNNIQYIGHIQIAQIPLRNEPHTPGEINFDYFFDLMEKLNYEGWIGLEYKPVKGTEEGVVE